MEAGWLRRQYILLARRCGGSALDWQGVPFSALGGWIHAVNDLDAKK